MQKKFLLSALLFLLVFPFVQAQKALLREAPLFHWHETLPAPGEALVLTGSLNEALDHAFDSITALTPIKGFNAAMLLPDGSSWKRTKGRAAELPAIQPLSTDHLMGMGSISKSVVATTLLLMYEDGLFQLDDSIGKFIGPYPNIPGHISIRQLLSHRSGLNDYINENPDMADAILSNLDSIWTADTILHHYVLAPNFPVGDDWSYSNTNYLLAGRIIEAISGKPWYEAVRARVLEPLGLVHTFAYPWEQPGNLPFAHVFVDLTGNGVYSDFQGFGLPDVGLFSAAGAAGCLISNPEDLNRFSERLYGGHLLKPETLAAMQVDYIQNGQGAKYGLGTASFPLPFNNLENWGHDGDLLYKSVALYFPQEKMALTVQQNDDRNYDPTDPNAQAYDLYVVYARLLDAYFQYKTTSATDAPENTGRLKTFPNPTSGLCSIALDDTASLPLPYMVLDGQGRLVQSGSMNSSSTEINLQGLPNGLYLLRAGTYSARVLKQ